MGAIEMTTSSGNTASNDDVVRETVRDVWTLSPALDCKALLSRLVQLPNSKSDGQFRWDRTEAQAADNINDELAE